MHTRSISQLRLIPLLILLLSLLLSACGGASENAPGADQDLPPDGDTDSQKFVCNPGTWACADTFTRGVCDEYGAGFMDTESCESGLICVGGACVVGGSKICTPGAYSCYDERSRWRCRADGLDYEGYELCPDGIVCEDGACGVSPADGDPEADVTPEADSAETESEAQEAEAEFEPPFELEPFEDESDEAESTPTDGDLEAEAEAEPEADLDTERDVEPEPEPDLDTETEPEPDLDTERESDSEVPVDGDLDAETDTDVPANWVFSDCLPKSGDALWSCLKGHLMGNKAYSYDQARKYMYGDIDYLNGKVECAYCGDLYNASTSGSTPSGMNCEHTWPQSFFNSASPMVSDLNHLFSTGSTANNRRSAYPFGNVVGSATWSCAGGSKLGKDANGSTVYQVRDKHKGDTARAIFYFAVRYEGIPNQHPWVNEAELRQWSHDDPPDDQERARNNAIQGYQNTRNPFVDHPEFVDAIPSFTAHTKKWERLPEPAYEAQPFLLPWWQEGLLQSVSP